MRLFVIVGLSVILASCAVAPVEEDAKACLEPTILPDRAIEQCTRLIQAGQGGNRFLAAVTFARAYAWERKRDYDRAIADYTEVIRLEPRDFKAYYNRGSIFKEHKHDFARAIADLDEAIRLEQRFASSYNNRGVAHHLSGHHDLAVSDFTAVLRVNPGHPLAHHNRGIVHFALGNFGQAAEDHRAAMDRVSAPFDGYSLLLRYLARVRSGESGSGDAALKELADGSAKRRTRGWPFPIIEFYLGRGDEQALRSHVRDLRPQQQQVRTCEINFYLSQWHLIRGTSAQAESLLRTAANDCPTFLDEYWAARMEVRRLEGR